MLDVTVGHHGRRALADRARHLHHSRRPGVECTFQSGQVRLVHPREGEERAVILRRQHLSLSSDIASTMAYPMHKDTCRSNHSAGNRTIAPHRASPVPKQNI
eukprot:2521589-Rhodomonas_salina.3